MSKVKEQPGIILWFYSVYRGEENGGVNLKELGKMDPQTYLSLSHQIYSLEPASRKRWVCTANPNQSHGGPLSPSLPIDEAKGVR